MIIGLVSDSHGVTGKLEEMLKLPEAARAECWLHAGDFTQDADYLAMVCGKPVHKVAGNGDWPTNVPEDLLLELGGHRIYLTHGHMQGVRSGTGRLADYAALQGADIAVYGHTHVADITPRNKQGVTVLNPGSVARPRDESRGSFMIMELEADREPEVTLIRLSDAHAFNFLKMKNR